VSNILGQPPEATAILLRHLRWNKERLIDQYMEKTDEVLESAGLGESDQAASPRLEKVPGFMCDICCEDDKDLESFAMKCGHRFCADCYRHYLRTKIKDEGEAARIRCPGDGCNRVVDSKTLDFLVSEDLRDRYVSCISSAGHLLMTTDTKNFSPEHTSTTKTTCGGALLRTVFMQSSVALRIRS
jgi:ariadne-1